MSDFDYGNARLRAMKSRLLSRRTLEALAETTSFSGLIAVLAQTGYRKPVEAALTRASGMDCINEALHLDLSSTLGTVRSFYRDQVTAAWVAILLRAYDIYNLKTILRALSQNAPPSNILPVLLPVGDLDSATLADLARGPGPRGLIDLLASMNAPFAQPLLRLRAERPGAQVPDMELALDRWYFRQSAASLKGASQVNATLSAALKLDADIANLLTVLRFANAPAERKLMGSRSGLLEENGLFVGPGRLSFDLLSRAASQDTLKAAVEILSGTPYEGSLREGLKAYEGSNRLSSFEKCLKRLRLDWARRMFEKDPLGIGVLIGYLALKINEVGNLRWIANGIQMGLKPSAIHMELELLS
jgi:V/A-type H+-transporting ATPase subunit C